MDSGDWGSDARTLTVSVLFVDVVASTALRAKVGEERADAFTRDLEARIGEIVDGHRGRVVKGLGDGVLAVFESAVDAVGAAVTLQQQVELAGRRDPDGVVQLRVGLSAGDVSLNDGDVLGTPVVEASRLCATAQPGQVLAADLVRSLSRGRGSFAFESVGELSLRGLPEPVPACRVMWSPLVEDDRATSRMPFPELLAPDGGISYVGRETVTGALTDVLADVLGGSECMAAALLSGEPGIGKTRTAAELARRAHAEGAVVLYGRCDEDLGVPFQPFVEALDFYTTHHPSPRLGRLAGELVRICPELPARVDGLPTAAVSDPRTEEYRLFEATTSWLIEASAESGLVLIVDDLHWATQATLLLLAHVLRGAAAATAARLLVIGTYRDTELHRSHPLTTVLANLRRVAGVQRLDLQGLDLQETVALVESVAGHELDVDGRRLAEAAYAETEGNPFFVGEVLRHFVETAAVSLVDGRWQVNDPGRVEVPEGVRDVLGRRLSRLSEPANRVLSVAAVIGRDFDVELLAQVTDVPDETLLDALDEASRARIVEETGPDAFRFFHAMVKETLYSELSSVRRRRLHQSILEVLEKLRPYDAVALAYHAVEAGPTGGDMGAAVSHLLDAAAQASGAADLAGAASYYRQAIELIDAGPPDPQRRLEAMCGLGEAQRDQSDPEFRETLLVAGRAALELELTDLAARAAIANFRGSTSVVNDVDAERVDVLEQALAAYEGKHDAEAALLVATLAAEVNYDPTVSLKRRLDLTDRAIAIAREIRDPRVLAEVLVRTGRANLVPERAAAAPDLLAEAAVLADQVGDPTLAAMVRVFGNAAYLGVGDFDRARRSIAEAVDIAATGCPPLVQAMIHANTVQHLLYQGHVAEAIKANDDFLLLGQQLGMADVEQWWAANTMTTAYLQGRIGDLADAAGEFADRYPAGINWRYSHAWMVAEAGRLSEARHIVDTYALGRPDAFPVDDLTIVGWSYLAMLALLLDDAALGAAAEAVLQPYQHLWVNIQIFANGSVVWTLGACAAAQGRYDEADQLFERADGLLAERGLNLHRNVHAWYHALSLSRSGSPTHRDRARQLAQAGAEQATAAGLDRLAERFQQLLASLPPE